MHLSKALTALTFVQGSLSAGLLLYSGRDCTGNVQEISFLDYVSGVCKSANRFQSYKENGWGADGYRVGFYDDRSCASKLYTTWARDGDYFQSHTCYNIDGNSANGEDFAESVNYYYQVSQDFSTCRC